MYKFGSKQVKLKANGDCLMVVYQGITTFIDEFIKTHELKEMQLRFNKRSSSVAPATKEHFGENDNCNNKTQRTIKVPRPVLRRRN